MRCVVTLCVFSLVTLYSVAARGEWESFDRRYESESSNPYDSFTGTTDSNFSDYTPSIAIAGCPEGTHYTSKVNAETLTVVESCVSDGFGEDDGVDYSDGKLEVDPYSLAADEYQSSYINSFTAGGNPLTSTYAAGRVGVSPNNPFLQGDSQGAFAEFEKSDNPFIQEVRNAPGLQMDESLVDQVRNNAALQQKIRDKLGGSPMAEKFNSLLGQ